MRERMRASVVDLFCGVGGLSHGFHLEGFSIEAGIDVDENCRYAYEANNNAPFICKDVSKLTSGELEDLFPGNSTKILIGCAPCQPFSIYNQKNNNPDWALLRSFAGLIKTVKPEIISMENVPRLQRFRTGQVFNEFVEVLIENDYSVSYDILYGPDFGLPQTRHRLVLIASLHGKVDLPKPTHIRNKPTVREAIGDLPALESGVVDSVDPLHRTPRLTDKNLSRIRASRPGGTWRDWSPELVTQCHKTATGRGYSSVYGRMTWDEPSPTITTQFYGYGNGRFGHPEQDRAISLREGAILQSFPRNYQFTKPGDEIYFSRVGKMIGNAVPVVIGQAIARQVREHLEKYEIL